MIAIYGRRRDASCKIGLIAAVGVADRTGLARLLAMSVRDAFPEDVLRRGEAVRLHAVCTPGVICTAAWWIGKFGRSRAGLLGGVHERSAPLAAAAAEVAKVVDFPFIARRAEGSLVPPATWRSLALAVGGAHDATYSVVPPVDAANCATLMPLALAKGVRGVTARAFVEAALQGKSFADLEDNCRRRHVQGLEDRCKVEVAHRLLQEEAGAWWVSAVPAYSGGKTRAPVIAMAETVDMAAPVVMTRQVSENRTVCVLPLAITVTPPDQRVTAAYVAAVDRLENARTRRCVLNAQASAVVVTTIPHLPHDDMDSAHVVEALLAIGETARQLDIGEVHVLIDHSPAATDDATEALRNAVAAARLRHKQRLEDPSFPRAKLSAFVFGRQPNYVDLFRYASSRFAGRVVAVANADCVLRGLGRVNGAVLRDEKRALVLSVFAPPIGSRFRTACPDHRVFSRKHTDRRARVLNSCPRDARGTNTWDAHLFTAPLETPAYSDLDRAPTPVYPNAMGAEHRAAHFLLASGYALSNACNHVTAEHWHCVGRKMHRAGRPVDGQLDNAADFLTDPAEESLIVPLGGHGIDENCWTAHQDRSVGR